MLRSHFSIKAVIVFIAMYLSTLSISAQSQSPSVQYISSFPAINHPQIAYWFFSKDQLNETAYKNKIDSLAQFSKYSLIFITSRNGINFYDTKTMHPIFEGLVKYAHSKGLKIGLQMWDKRYNVPIENTERLIQDTETILDENGKATVSVVAKGAREMRLLLKNELFNVYAFKKTGNGFYDANSLKIITDKCKAVDTKKGIDVTVNADQSLKGYTVLLLTQHYYNFCSNHSAEAVANLTNALKDYSDIPFDGVGLDEYSNLRVSTTWELKKANDVFRASPYSLSMAAAFKKNTGGNLGQTLFDMRYAPQGKPEVRMAAINAYMAMQRYGTMNMEQAIYDKGKEYFGRNTFIGLHDTHHNFLDGDEVWQTGLNWWNVKRDYGHTDEGTPTATQMGIGFCYPMNVMYNMYYNKSLDNIVDKALTDLRYGIRTHYHAINDVQNWGISVEKPTALEQINKVENAARLLNRFNPSFPQIKLLVVFGMEAQVNWYPDSTARNINNINGSLDIEKKANQIWDAGYRNALVPTDVIADGRLKIGANGKPVLQGHVFDAVVFLYPQYAKETTLKFLENYIAKGGKLMLEGTATNDFNGKDITARWKKIADKAVATKFSIDDILKLGITQNGLVDGAINEDGSYTFTNTNALKSEAANRFSFTQNEAVFSGTYSTLAAIKIDATGKVEKFTATGFSSLQKNGETIFSLSQPADVYVEIINNKPTIIIADTTKNKKITTTKF